MFVGTRRFALTLVVLAFFGSASHAGTTLINFDSLGLGNESPIPSTYGSNAPDTPDISVSYRTFAPSDNSTFQNFLVYWNTGYGSFASAAIADGNGFGSEVGFTVGAGFQGTVNSFELAGFGGDQTPDYIRIVDSSNNVLWSPSSLTVSGSSSTSYSPALTFTGSVYIQVSDGWNIGINNISISETTITPPPVPEPSSVVMAGIAMGMVGIVRLRRRAR